MVNVEPWDNLEDVDCRWKIEGWGLVVEKDLGKELKAYFRAVNEEVSE